MSANQVDYGVVVPNIAYSVERAALAIGCTVDQLRDDLINAGLIRVCPIGRKGKYLILGQAIIDYVVEKSECLDQKSK